MDFLFRVVRWGFLFWGTKVRFSVLRGSKVGFSVSGSKVEFSGLGR